MYSLNSNYNRNVQVKKQYLLHPRNPFLDRFNHYTVFMIILSFFFLVVLPSLDSTLDN